MKATKTPGNIVVTLEMSDEEFEVFKNVHYCSPLVLMLNERVDVGTARFYNTTRKLVKAILYGGQEEIVSNG